MTILDGECLGEQPNGDLHVHATYPAGSISKNDHLVYKSLNGIRAMQTFSVGSIIERDLINKSLGVHPNGYFYAICYSCESLSVQQNVTGKIDSVDGSLMTTSMLLILMEVSVC